MNIKDKCVDLITNELAMTREEVLALLEIPPKEDMGDLAMPCFKLAKVERRAPQVIAKDFAERLRGKADFLEKVVSEGPYVNFYYDKGIYAEMVFADAEKHEGKLLHHQQEKKEGVILVEYSSPNIAKPFHVGHGFSTCLGDAIANMFDYLGYEVKRLNHLGDYGTQFGRLIYAWLAWGEEAALEEDAIKELTRVYIKFHEEAEKDESLYDKARAHFRHLENGEAVEYGLWQRFRDLSLQEFSKIYDRLKISFDSYNGESFYSDKIPQVVELLKEKELLEESEGAQVVNLDDYKLSPCIILKSDGSSIYATRDLAAIFYRAETYDYQRNIYIVGREQKFHFQQCFAVLDRLDHPKKDMNVHVAFGHLHFGTESFSTRQGKIIRLEDLLDETLVQVKKVMREGSFDMPEEEFNETAEAIAIATVKFLYLKSGRENDISFTWEEILDFNGDTAAYLLYAYARAKSVLRRAGIENLNNTDAGLLESEEEFQVLKDLSALEGALEEAVKAYEPSVFVRQIIRTVRNFNRFYQEKPILRADKEEVKLARLALCQLFSEQLKIALGILGIEVVERM